MKNEKTSMIQIGIHIAKVFPVNQHTVLICKRKPSDTCYMRNQMARPVKIPMSLSFILWKLMQFCAITLHYQIVSLCRKNKRLGAPPIWGMASLEITRIWWYSPIFIPTASLLCRTITLKDRIKSLKSEKDWGTNVIFTRQRLMDVIHSWK